MQQIADRHGITRQRVSQIVQDFELKRLRARGRSRARSYLAAADLVVLCDWIDRRGGGEAFTEFARRH